MTSMNLPSGSLPSAIQDILFCKSTHDARDMITFAKEIRPKLDLSSTYIFTDAEGTDIDDSGNLWNNARVLITFVAPTSGQSLTLRLKHSGEEDLPLIVTLGSTMIKLNSSSKSSLTIDDITLHPIQVPGSSESDRLSFKPEIWNDIVIQFEGSLKTLEAFLSWRQGHTLHHKLHDIELLDEAGLEYTRPHSASLRTV